MKQSKRFRAVAVKVDTKKEYTIDDAHIDTSFLREQVAV